MNMYNFENLTLKLTWNIYNRSNQANPIVWNSKRFYLWTSENKDDKLVNNRVSIREEKWVRKSHPIPKFEWDFKKLSENKIYFQ